MKKVTLLSFIISTLFLAGCSSIKDTKVENSALVSNVTGKAKTEKVYWHTDEDGTNSVNVKNDKFRVRVPRRTSKTKVTLADKKRNLKNADSITVPAARKMMNYSDFVYQFENHYYDYDSDSDLSLTSADDKLDGLNEIYHSKKAPLEGVKIRATTDDEALTGLVINMFVDNNNNTSKIYTYSLAAAAETLSKTNNKVLSAVTKAANKRQKIKVNSHGYIYTLDGTSDQVLICSIYKK